MHKSDDEHDQHDEMIYIISMYEDVALVLHGNGKFNRSVTMTMQVEVVSL